MQILRSNFKQLLPKVYQSIEKSAFIGIDLEFTGLVSHPDLSNSNLDSIQTRYWKEKQNVQNFIPLQVGLCCFEFKDNQIYAEPYTFHLYPTVLEPQVDLVFTVQASSLLFLSQYAFDFNKNLYDGVSWLNPHELEKIKQNKQLDSLKAKYLQTLRDQLTPDGYALYKQIRDQAYQKIEVEKWENLKWDIKFTKRSAIRYIIKNLQDQNYDCRIDNDELVVFKKEGNQVISPIEIEEKVEVTDDDLLGFSKIIQSISSLKKPIVLHNSRLDIFYLQDKFLQPLPATLTQFQHSFNEFFPTLYDTRYILQTSNVLKKMITDKNKLSDIFQQVQNQVTIQVDNKSLKEAEHEAGYDAYMTGVIFLWTLKYLGISLPEMINSSNLKLNYFKNKVPLSGGRFPMALGKDLQIDDSADKQKWVFVLSKYKGQVIELQEQLQKIFGDDILISTLYWSNEMFYLIPGSLQTLEKIKKVMEDKAIYELQLKNNAIIIHTFEGYSDRIKNKLSKKNKMPEILELLN